MPPAVHGVPATGGTAVDRRPELTRVHPGPVPAEPQLLPPHPLGVVVPAPRTIPMPACPAPRVSIVIPAYGQPALTLHCLNSIERARTTTPFEVIVVDDASPDGSAAVIAEVPNVAVWRIDANVGYLRAVNLGATLARGEYLCLLNNDTEVVDDWLDALVATLDGDDRVAIAGAKLLYDGGTVQEAGGIVFRDGSGWNYGRGDTQHSAHYAFVRDVDYCSAAGVLVRRSFWVAAGGYDERYAPAYYEDTDLAFTARAHGYRVVYQPDAIVYHYEGGSHGRDESAGVKSFQRVNREKFVAKWQAELAEQHTGPEHLQQARSRSRGPRVLLVDEELPRPDRDSGRLRTWQIVQSLRRQGCQVSIRPLHLSAEEPWATWLRQHGVELLLGPVDLDSFLPSFDPDLVLLFRPSAMAGYLVGVRQLCPRATVVYDTVDLHHLRLARQRELADDLSLAMSQRCYEVLETAYAELADVTITLSEEERAAVERRVPGADVRILSNINAEQPVGPGFDARRGVLFVGNHRHPPNLDAALFLANEVMPLVWSRQRDVPLVLAGAAPPSEIRLLAGPRTTVHDWLPDLAPLYRGVRVAIAPLRFGAGVKGKVSEALSHGVPLVTTPIGAEGTGVQPGESALLADTAEELADAVLRLHADRQLWLRLAAAARRQAQSMFSPAAADRVLGGLLAGTGRR